MFGETFYILFVLINLWLLESLPFLGQLFGILCSLLSLLSSLLTKLKEVRGKLVNYTFSVIKLFTNWKPFLLNVFTVTLYQSSKISFSNVLMWTLIILLAFRVHIQPFVLLHFCLSHTHLLRSPFVCLYLLLQAVNILWWDCVI